MRSLPSLLALLLLVQAAFSQASAPMLAEHLRKYAGREYPCRITGVAAGPEEIRILGTAGGEKGELALAEIPLLENVTERTDFTGAEPLHPGADGTFTVVKKRAGPAGDRLFSRWAVVSGGRLVSHARFAETVQPVRAAPPAREPLRTRKGVGGYGLGNPQEDLEELGLSAVTVNIVLSSYMRSSGGEGRTAFPYGGRTWYYDNKAVAGMDATFLELARKHQTVSAIILVPRPPASSQDTTSFSRLVAHPDNAGGIFALPNLTSEAGFLAYAAAMDFLAERYTRADGAHGRIHDWIMFNEVNSCWSWANAGDKPEWVYADLLTRSIRAAWLIVRQYDPGADVFVSLDQHWTASPGAHCFPGRSILERISDFCAAEGDFPWAVAHHPYPQSLLEPKVWLDTQATFAFDTPKITFKNLEVLVAYLGQPRLRYRGRERRLQLTEQGLNSKDYSEEQLQLQAAGMAYAWNKVKRLPEIEMFHYHNWIDNRAEGGLRIGLRRFRNDETDPLGRKPIWYVYQALGTPGEAAATDFALPLIGISDWAAVLYRGAIH